MIWLLNGLIFTLDILTFGFLIAIALNAFRRGILRYVWSDRAPWVPPLMATLFAIVGIIPVLAIYWVRIGGPNFPLGCAGWSISQCPLRSPKATDCCVAAK